MGHLKWQQAELACCEASVSSCPVCPCLPLHTDAYLCSSPSHQSLRLPGGFFWSQPGTPMFWLHGALLSAYLPQKDRAPQPFFLESRLGPG